MDLLDPQVTYTQCLGTVSSTKSGTGVIEWHTEEYEVSVKIKFLSNEHHVTDKQHVHFSAHFNASSNQWVATNVVPASYQEGVVYGSPDKNLVIKYGKRQLHYRIMPGEEVVRCIRIRPGDRLKFLGASSVFATPSFCFAHKVDLIAHGTIDCVVQDHGKDTGVYIKWRACEDANNERPSEERIFHMFRVSGEAKFLRPGLRVTLTPVLLIKKTTGRLNLTSVFGTLVCYAEAVVTDAPQVLTKRGGQGVLPGKARLVQPHHGMIVEFYRENVVTPDSPRPLRVNDKVMIQMKGDIETTAIDIALTLSIEGSIVLENGVFEIAETNNGTERRWRIASETEDAILGHLPLREGDLVRCAINASNMVENIRVLSEVEGKVHAANLLLLRGTTVAVFKPKNPRAFKVGDHVLAHLDWADTHYRASEARVYSPIAGAAGPQSSSAAAPSAPTLQAPPRATIHNVPTQQDPPATHSSHRTSPPSNRAPPNSPQAASKAPPANPAPGPSSTASGAVPRLSLPASNPPVSGPPRGVTATSPRSSAHPAPVGYTSPLPVPVPAMKSPPTSPMQSRFRSHLNEEQEMDNFVESLGRMPAGALGDMMEEFESQSVGSPSTHHSTSSLPYYGSDSSSVTEEGFSPAPLRRAASTGSHINSLPNSLSSSGSSAFLFAIPSTLSFSDYSLTCDDSRDVNGPVGMTVSMPELPSYTKSASTPDMLASALAANGFHASSPPGARATGFASIFGNPNYGGGWPSSPPSSAPQTPHHHGLNSPVKTSPYATPRSMESVGSPDPWASSLFLHQYYLGPPTPDLTPYEESLVPNLMMAAASRQQRVPTAAYDK